MPVLSATDQDKLRERFAQELQGDVRLVLFAEPPSGLFVPGRAPSQTGRVATQLLEEIEALSPKLRLEVHHPRIDRELAQKYGVERSPAIVLLPVDQRGAGAGSDGGAPESNAQDARQGSPASNSSAPPNSSATAEPPPRPLGDLPERPSAVGLVRFFGLPSGYEFMTLIEDIVDLSKGSTRLAAATRQAVADLPGPAHLQVFVTPT